MRKFKCLECGHVWELPFGEGGRGVDQICPKCNSRTVYRASRLRGFGWRRGQRGIACDEPFGQRGRGQGQGWFRRG